MYNITRRRPDVGAARLRLRSARPGPRALPRAAPSRLRRGGVARAGNEVVPTAVLSPSGRARRGAAGRSGDRAPWPLAVRTVRRQRARGVALVTRVRGSLCAAETDGCAVACRVPSRVRRPSRGRRIRGARTPGAHAPPPEPGPSPPTSDE